MLFVFFKKKQGLRMNLNGGRLEQVQITDLSMLLLGKQNNNRGGSCYPFSI